MIPDTTAAELCLVAAQRALRAATGESYVTIKAEIGSAGEVLWQTYTDGSGKHLSALNLTDAITAQVDALCGPAVVAAKREQAAKLLSEADHLAERFAESRTVDRSPSVNFHD
jgi:hypothetical protein